MLIQPKYLKLSYNLSASGPYPPAIPRLETEVLYSIEQDGANVYKASITSHSGTHVDAPYHVAPEGYKITDFSMADFVFDRPCCIFITIGDTGLFQPEHLEPYRTVIEKSDLLLIKTGYGQYRESDPVRYSLKNPGFSIKAAQYLRDTFPSLRALGLDVISLAAIEVLEEGMEAHRVLLGGAGRKFLIFEDLNLQDDLSDLQQVIALPLLMDGVDSGPCTVLGISRGSQ
ncbi:MAG TPA: cyclase family protein [Bacilli bacterium]